MDVGRHHDVGEGRLVCKAPTFVIQNIFTSNLVRKAVTSVSQNLFTSRLDRSSLQCF